MEYTPDTPAKRVARGAKFLDHHVPDWERRVDTNSLNIAFPNSCTLGQLFGEYGKGVEELRLNRPQTVEFGFFSSDDNDGEDRTQYPELTELWKDEVNSRVLATI